MYHFRVGPTTVGKYDDLFFVQKKFPQKVKCLNLEVKTIQEKRKQLLWRLILVWGKAMTQIREKQK